MGKIRRGIFSRLSTQAMDKISLHPVSLEHISFLHRWYNTPHVQAFYSLRSWTEEEVLQKFYPQFLQETPVFGSIVLLNHMPIGYVQYYSLEDFPWQGIDPLPSAAGLDLFIGESKWVGKGIGAQIVSFVLKQKIWPSFSLCLVDPDVRNLASIRMFEKCGFERFKTIDTQDALQRRARLHLMKIDKREEQ